MRDLDAFVAKLVLDVDGAGICHACLSFVSFPLDDGDVREARRATRQMTPVLWEEGLAESALDAVRAACADGVPDADEALRELEWLGGRSEVARAIVMRLAADLAAEARRRFRLLEAARERLDAAPPEWN
jgi:hypothetical protein